jgi:exodeoxyribonuclease VII small subunit
MKKELSYDEAYAELVEIMHELEEGDTGVDTLTLKVKRAMELIRICKERLLLTEREINELIKE